MRYNEKQLKELAECWFRTKVKAIIPFYGNPLQMPIQLSSRKGKFRSNFIITDMFFHSATVKTTDNLFLYLTANEDKTAIFSMLHNGNGNQSYGEYVTNLSNIFCFANGYEVVSEDKTSENSFQPWQVVINGYEIIF